MMTLPPRPDAPLPVGISQCLLGDEVRYDGTGAKSSMPHLALENLFEYHSICPEVGIGMSTPRAPIRLVDFDGDIRVVGVKDATTDVTQALTDFAHQSVSGLEHLAGYVFMHNSPSCGLFRVKVYPPKDAPARRNGRGAFARVITQRLPYLPVEEAGRLFDDVLRENFVTRTFAYAHWQSLGEEVSPGLLVAFHSAYKYLLMAHSLSAYKAAGRLLSDLKENLAEKRQAYIGILMEGLAQPASRGGHANVLSHLQGYLKKRLDAASRQELDSVIQAYRRGEQPLLVPLALLKHHFRRYPDEYVLRQSYLDPHPHGAALRRSL